MKLLKLSFFLFISLNCFSQTNENYISVGYSSICCGTPSKKPVLDYILKFELENDLNPFEILIESGLGKEGEFIYYIGIDNLNPELLCLFWNELKVITENQDKNRSENRDGYVNVNNKFISNSTLKTIKSNPRTRISSLEIYNYKN